MSCLNRYLHQFNNRSGSKNLGYRSSRFDLDHSDICLGNWGKAVVGAERQEGTTTMRNRMAGRYEVGDYTLPINQKPHSVYALHCCYAYETDKSSSLGKLVTSIQLFSGERKTHYLSIINNHSTKAKTKPWIL
ncbi:hypothetical protein RJT34_20552 [Clitoria ternatea]|uniref:Uncharacterized protein n=1 Tax=Clitoria ternatea TaxID=43366 RepID=A0AAN9P5W3_CLITE